MDNNDTKPSWRDKIGGKAQNGGLPKLADQFDDAPSSDQETGSTSLAASTSDAPKPLAQSGKVIPPPSASSARASVLPPPAANNPTSTLPKAPPIPKAAPLPPPPAPRITVVAPSEDDSELDVPRITSEEEKQLPAPSKVSTQPRDRDDEDTSKSSSPQTFAERLRARREEAERAGEESGETLGRGLHLRPAVDELPEHAEELVEHSEEAISELSSELAPLPPSNVSEGDGGAQIGDEIADPPIFNKRSTPQETPVVATSSLGDGAPVGDVSPIPSAPAAPVAARPAYDYSAQPAPAAVAPPPPRPREVQHIPPVPPLPPTQPAVAYPPVREPLGYAPPAEPSAPVGQVAGHIPASSIPAPQAATAGYALPPASNYVPPPPPNAPQQGQFQSEYRYADERYEDPATGYRSAHARELDYADGNTYGSGPYSDQRATASDYEDAYNEYDERYEDEPRGRKGPILLLSGLLVIGAIAAGLIYYFLQNQGDSMTSGAPPVVAPSPSSVKVTPAPGSSPQAPTQTKLFYDRIVGEETVEGEQLVPREEKPLDPAQPAQSSGAATQAPAPAPAAPSNNNDQLPQGDLPVPLPPPLPGGQTNALPAGGDTPSQQAALGSGKTSRAVVSPVAASGKQSLDVPGASTLSSDPTTGSTGDKIASLSDPSPPGSGLAPPLPRQKPEDQARASRARAAANSAAVVASNTSSSTPTSTSNQGGPLNLSPNTGSNALAPAPAPQPTQQVASLQQTAPPAPAPAPAPVQQTQPAPVPTSPTSDGAYIVQLASFKDEGSARSGFKNLQGKHPGMLGGYSPLISETKVGSFGTFYRLQVGPVASAQSARQMCSTLLAAGEKDCIVKRR